MNFPAEAEDASAIRKMTPRKKVHFISLTEVFVSPAASRHNHDEAKKKKRVYSLLPSFLGRSTRFSPPSEKVLLFSSLRRYRRYIYRLSILAVNFSMIALIVSVRQLRFLSAPHTRWSTFRDANNSLRN